MVCDDCKSKLSSLATNDPFKGGSSGGPVSSRMATNTLLRKGVKANPYSNHCKICKQKCQVQGAMYCTVCAYAKGICAICGKEVLDITMYKMSEGGGFNTVRERDQKSFKSPEQIAREEAQTALLEYLSEIGQPGKMPTKVALEKAGKKDLADALIRSYGGLHAAADVMGLSKRQLNEEAEMRKQAKTQAAQKAAELSRIAAQDAPGLEPDDASEEQVAEKEDLPPGVHPRVTVSAPAPIAVSALPAAVGIHRPPEMVSTDTR